MSLAGCATGATLRTAQVLGKGKKELSGGVSGTPLNPVSGVAIFAYGITENLEIEARYEYDFIALTPRVQLLRAKKARIDCVGFFEVGYAPNDRLQWGPGVIIGRNWDSLSPYISYKFRHNNFFTAKEKEKGFFDDYFTPTENFHYLKIGCRYYPSYFQYKAKSKHIKWFVDLEVGPTFFDSDVIAEWAGCIGCNF